MEYKWMFLGIVLAAIVATTVARSHLRQEGPIKCPNVIIRQHPEIYRLQEILEERKDKEKGKPNNHKDKGSKENNGEKHSNEKKDSDESKDTDESKSDENSSGENSGEFTTATLGTETASEPTTGEPQPTDGPAGSSIATSTSTTPFVYLIPCKGYCREFCLVSEREETRQSCAPFVWCKCCVSR
ncbi:probable serine/threonine-protein kinase roco5 [Macrobrachium rosenbergii]|uniref:probable serine/threonine-protein kinase roco5 n=1 Tax=Macrobrachium rosenbergii TaxID=79674 RepID=UPI0034D4E617